MVATAAIAALAPGNLARHAARLNIVSAMFFYNGRNSVRLRGSWAHAVRRQLVISFRSDQAAMPGRCWNSAFWPRQLVAWNTSIPALGSSDQVAGHRTVANQHWRISGNPQQTTSQENTLTNSHLQLRLQPSCQNDSAAYRRSE